MQERRGVVLLGMVMRYTLGIVCVRCSDCSHKKQCRPQHLVRRHQHGRILDLLGEGQELLAQFVRRLILGAYDIIPPQTTQD